MKGLLLTLVGIVIAGMVVLLCLFSCILASKSDKYWQDFIDELEKKKNERH